MSDNIEPRIEIQTRKNLSVLPENRANSNLENEDREKKKTVNGKSKFSENFVLGISGESFVSRMKRYTRLW